MSYVLLLIGNNRPIHRPPPTLIPIPIPSPTPGRQTTRAGVVIAQMVRKVLVLPKNWKSSSPAQIPTQMAKADQICNPIYQVLHYQCIATHPTVHISHRHRPIFERLMTYIVYQKRYASDTQLTPASLMHHDQPCIPIGDVL